MNKKILIFYGSYGAGHFSAANSIKDYIDTNYPNVETKMIDCIEYINKYYNKISVKTYDNITRKMTFAWKSVYYGAETWPIRKITSNTNKLFAIKLNHLIREFKPDLVISTHFFASEMCAILKKRKKLNCKIATIMTDYAPHKQWLAKHEYIDYFFVAHNGMKKYLNEYGIDNDKIYVTGIPLSNKFLINYDKEETLQQFGLSNNKTTILFFAGGSSHIARGTASNIFDSFIRSFPDVQVVTIAGKSPELKKKFEDLVGKSNKQNSIKVLPFTDKVPQLMQIADIVITKPGGLTTTESLASGLPIIVIDPIPGQEEENAEYLESQGAAIWIKKHDNVDEILHNIFSDSQKIKEMKIQAEIIAKRNSTHDICEILMEPGGHYEANI